MKITAAMLLLASTAGIADARSNRFKIPLPTAAQLKYQEQEIVALTHFNMATFFRNGDPACDNINWAKSQQPASFAPTNLNVSNWIENYKAVGAKSGILTAKHGCGFLLWPTNVTLPNGDNYGYHIGGEGGLGIDLAAEFSEKMQEAGLPHSFYYSLKDSFYLNAIGDAVKPPSTLLPGQVNVTQDQFEDISVAAVTELWSRYGDLVRRVGMVSVSSRSQAMTFAACFGCRPKSGSTVAFLITSMTVSSLCCRSCNPTLSPWVPGLQTTPTKLVTVVVWHPHHRHLDIRCII